MAENDRLLIVEPEAFESTAGNYLVTCGNDLLIPGGQESRLYWAHDRLDDVLPDQTPTHFLGFYNDEPFFTLNVEPEDCRQLGGESCSLFSLLGQYPDGFFRLLGRAVQINGWYRDHRFCGRCGSPTRRIANERAMSCPECGLVAYPRLSPCIMALITRGDKCLLARNKQWRRKEYFSVLAGFVEPGESVEDALRREVREEVGLEVGDLHYFHSQPWPFPGQLMIGFFADYGGGEIRVDDIEIAEAHWYHYNDLPPVPGDFSLSGQLIRHFVRECEARNRG
jgi:NAD+ diphosphatase